MLCDPNWSYSTEYTFTSKTSFSSPLSPFPLSEASSLRVFRSGEKKIEPPFSQALLLLSLQQYCSGSKPSRKLFCYCPCSNTAVAQNLRLHFSRKLQKKRYRKFSHLFFAFFSQKACSRFDPKKGFKFQSFFNAS